MTEVQIKIFGQVQGVFFRSETAEKAQELGIKGWIRNEPDGTVFVVAQGDDPAIQKLLTWCKTGPAGAHVDNIEATTEEEPKEVFEVFEVRY